MSLSDKAFATWLRSVGFRARDVASFEANVKRKGSAYAMSRISRSVLEDYERFSRGELTSFDWIAAAKASTEQDPEGFFQWMDRAGVDSGDARRQARRWGVKKMIDHQGAFMRSYGRWLSEQERGHGNKDWPQVDFEDVWRYVVGDRYEAGICPHRGTSRSAAQAFPFDSHELTWRGPGPIDPNDPRLSPDPCSPRDVARYAQRMKQGSQPPAVVLVERGPFLSIADGAHRIAAARIAGLSTIDAYIGTPPRRRGSLNRHEAGRARMRFMDAEQRGENPWAATSRRINAMQSQKKFDGMRIFLRELMAERPGDTEEIRSLLHQVSEVAEPTTLDVVAEAFPGSIPPAQRQVSLDRVARAISLDRVAARLGVATADPSESSPMVGVLLAKVYKAEDPCRYWMSEKLDGVRAIWDGERFWSRNGKPFFAPQWFKDDLPNDTVLDGELFAGRGKFRDTISTVRRRVPNDKQWRGIKYLVFDAPLIGGSFEDRMKRVDLAIRGSRVAQAVEQRACSGRAELDAFQRQIAAQGGEGVMLRLKGSQYEGKRSGTLLKKKSFVDEEAVIVGYQKGLGKHRGRLGAYHAQLVRTGATFKVGTGLDDQHREAPLPKGSVITVRYQELTPGGIPRFPVFIGARDYE